MLLPMSLRGYQKNWLRFDVWSLVVGALVGWATLIRPQAVLLPFFLLPAVAFFRSRLSLVSKTFVLRIALVSAGLAAVVAPWSYRNYRAFGEFVLVSTNGGDNLLIGNGPNSTQKCEHPPELYANGLPRFGEIEVDFERAEVKRAGQVVNMAAKELQLLQYLIHHRDRVVPRDEILQKVWEYASEVNSRTIDVHVAWLRQKLDNPQNPKQIQTIRGKGYRFTA